MTSPRGSRKPPQISDRDRMFFHGVLSALHVCHIGGPTSLFNDIVNACGKDFLIHVARQSGQMRISGMSEYLLRRKP